MKKGKKTGFCYTKAPASRLPVYTQIVPRSLFFFSFHYSFKMHNPKRGHDEFQNQDQSHPICGSAPCSERLRKRLL